MWARSWARTIALADAWESISGSMDALRAPSCEVAAIPTHWRLKAMPRFQVLLPRFQEPEKLASISPLPPFASEALGFIDTLSHALLRSAATKTYPELVALGFWMRAANLN